MPELMIREHHSHHGFGDGNAAYADAGVMATFGLDVDLFAFGGHRAGLLHHGGGRLYRNAANDFIAIANAA